VGIGTSSPARPLHVKHSSTSNPNIVLFESSDTTNNKALIRFSDPTTTSITAQPHIGSAGDDLIIHAGNTERMRIDSSGNVGINEDNPSKQLQIYKEGGNNLEIQFVTRNANSGTGVAAIGFNVAATYEGDYTQAGIGLVRGIPNGGGSLCFYNAGSSATTSDFTTAHERMRIDTSGNVKINNLGSGDVYATGGTLYISSDIRLKNDLGTIDESGIEIIKQLTPRYYSWKDDESSRQQLGFFAQEVFPILPEAVPRDLKYEQNGVDENGEPILEQVLDDNGEPDYQWGFATQPIVAMCVKAIQEQQTLIESQQSQIDALTARIEALETN